MVELTETYALSSSPASSLSAVSTCHGRLSQSLSIDDGDNIHHEDAVTENDISSNTHSAADISSLTRKWKMFCNKAIRELRFLTNYYPSHLTDRDKTFDDRIEMYPKFKAHTLKIITLFSILWWVKKIIQRQKLKGSSYALLSAFLSQRKARLKKISDFRCANEQPISLLLSAAKNRLVQKALVNDRVVAYKLVSSKSWKKSSLPKNISSEVVTALSDGGCSDISVLPESMLSRTISLLVPASPFIYLALLYQMMKRLQKDRDDFDYTSTDDLKSNTKTTFADVAGVDSAKDELNEIVSYLCNPSPFISLGASPPNGVLLFGPPGNGECI